VSSATHTEPEEIVDDHREVAEGALKEATGVGAPGVSSELSELSEPKQDETDKMAKEKKS
jgi:hypothetical protein